MKNSIFIIVVLFSVFTNHTSAQSFTQTGKASYYANKFENKITASGEIYKHSLFTAAHKTLAFGTIVKVTNISNGKSITVKINDRGPFVEDRIIDVSKSAALELDFVNDGIAEVKIETVDAEMEQKPIEKNSTKKAKTQLNFNHDTTETETSYSTTNVLPQNITAEQKSIVASQVSTTYYKLNAERIIPKGFGVQIASYQESANLIERISIVENELKQKITIQIVNSNSARIYRLIVGEFDTRAKAEYFKDSIKNSYQGFVVTF